MLHTYSGHKWQFPIASNILGVNNVNFTLLLTSIDQEWEFHIATNI